MSLNQIKFNNMVGIQGSKTYSDVTFDPDSNIVRDILIPPPGGIFEIRFPDDDLIGMTV